MLKYFSCFIIILLFGCYDKNQKLAISNLPTVHSNFNSYWYAGKAEVNNYQLTQARYGELREGEATMIFVTEDFSTSKQVKLDNPANAGNDKLTVLKLNFLKRFNTGIYPYTLMLSNFTAVDMPTHPFTIKSTCSITEWCGQVYAQLNFKNNQFKINSYSYFETESDTSFTIKPSFTEDEIWNKIRLNPASLPTGKIEILNGLFNHRMLHQPLQIQEATTSKDSVSNNPSWLNTTENLHQYKVIFKNNRELIIYYQAIAPFKIMGWQETYEDGFADNKKLQTTKAVLKKTMMIDYWKHNQLIDNSLRDSLSIKF